MIIMSKKHKKDNRNESLNINNLHTEQEVQQYKYLGSTINASNSIKEEMKQRIAFGTKARCASETWVLKEIITQKLLVFERKILRRIFGPTKENQI